MAEAVADCSLVIGTTAARARELHQPLKRLELGAVEEIRKRLAAEPVALMFGSEKRGLLKDELSHCHWLLRYRPRRRFDEFGAGGGGMSLRIITWDGNKAGAAKSAQAAASGDVERITGALLVALQVSGTVNPKTAVSSEEKIRRLTRRLQSCRNTQVWLGMLQTDLWKLRK